MSHTPARVSRKALVVGLLVLLLAIQDVQGKLLNPKGRENPGGGGGGTIRGNQNPYRNVRKQQGPPQYNTWNSGSRPRINSNGGGGYHTAPTATNSRGSYSQVANQNPRRKLDNDPRGPTASIHTTPHQRLPGLDRNVPNQQGPPQYNTWNSGSRPRINSNGGGGYHTTPTATNSRGVQSSNFGAMYNSPGQLPTGATYQPSGYAPPGATYSAPGQNPAGGSYYPTGGIPHGISSYPQQPVSTVPVGPIFPPAGAPIPSEAGNYPQVPKTSSHPGLGKTLMEGAGTLMGHVLNTTLTELTGHGSSNSGGGGGGNNIVVINNGVPGSITTTDMGHGTTVINTGSALAVPAPAQPPAQAPASAAAPEPATAPKPTAVHVPGVVLIPGAPTYVKPPAQAPAVAPPSAAAPEPATAPIPGATPVPGATPLAPIPTTVAPAVSAAGSTIPAANVTPSPGSVPLAAFQPTPVTVPEGSVPLAPLQAGAQPESRFNYARNGGEAVSQWSSLSALFTILVAYCLH